MKFNDLSIQEKAAVIKLGVGGGLRSLLEIQLFWDGMPDDPPVILDDYYPGFDEYKKGGSIHIKPENRGKFTALKKRTGHSASWFKAHGTPALRKMATFALNARKWHHKHPDGGYLDRYDFGPRYNMPNEFANMLTLGAMHGFNWEPEKHVDLNELYNRLMYLESEGDPTAYNSGSKAIGLFLITPIALQEYLNYNPNDTGDLYDPEYNKRVRDWHMQHYYDTVDWSKYGYPSERRKYELSSAFFNAGKNSVDKKIQLAKNAGLDIYNGDGWKTYLKPETRNYVNFIMNGVDASNHKTQDKYQEWLNSGNKHIRAYGGPDDPPKKRFKTPEEILAEKYGIEPMVMDNVVQLIPVVTQAMKNEYANTPLGLAEQFGTIGEAENTNAFQRKVREIRNSNNPMWFGAYFVPYLGLGMLLSNAAERIMSGQYGLGLFDTGLAFAPYLSKALKPFIRNTRKAFEFNINPTNANSGVRTEYPWLNWNSTTELSPFVRNTRSNINPIYDTEGNVRGWQSIDGNPILEAPKSNNINSDILFENNFFDLKPYTPEWTENGIGRYVDRKGMINRYEFENLFPLIEKENPFSYKDPRTIFNKNQGKQRDLLNHSYLVAKTANDIPLPKGVTRQDLVFSALMHDIGKTINPKETHGLTSARLVNQLIFNRGIKPENPEYVYPSKYLDNPMSQTSQNAKIFNAIYRHMDADSYLDKYPEAGLLQALRFADVSRGLSYDLAAAKYPHLLTYDRDLPVMHK